RSSVPGRSATIIYNVQVATNQAYNPAGGHSLYPNIATPVLSKPPEPPGGKVSLRRPGGGPSEVFDTSLIAWLETRGYGPLVEYCTDLDLHQDKTGTLLNSYKLLLVVGHSEYWSWEMRRNVERFICNGGNVAFLSSNTCWWRIHFVDGD